jgi:arylsulfatase A-like enzyme
MNWDAHEDVVQNHTQEAAIMDRPVAALIRDLKARGLLDDTLVIWTSEFGRTPFTEANKTARGRDHNQLGFTSWLAGAGVKPGISFGATDELGHRAVEDPVTLYDFHATILHLLGLDHERLTFYHNGIKRRLTDVHGRVIREILA